jgi:Fe-S-cluster containining protein
MTIPIVTEEFLCVRCSRHMKTCCQTADIYTTLGDVRRMEEYTGQTGFTEFRAPKNPAYADQDDDPIWRDNVFRPDGTRRVVKKQANGDCTFLGAAGCILPLETRPLICRIYPFDYTAEGILDELSEGCPTELLRPGQGLIEALDMNRTDAERWHRQLYDELPNEDLSVLRRD